MGKFIKMLLRWMLLKEYFTLFILALSISIATRFWPGGYDALHFYLRAPFPETTAPGWVYLVTYPASWLGWPLGWQIITFLNVWIIGTLALIFDKQRWWVIFLAPPLWWTIWLGQIEFWPASGYLIFLLVKQGYLSPTWLGMSWIAVLTKPQVGLGLLGYQWYWWYRQKRKKFLKRASLLKALLFAVGIVFVSITLWPQWPLYWLQTLRTFQATWWNASIWPYGLLTLPFTIYIFPRLREDARIRVVATTSLLISPYFALYHCSTLLAFARDWVTIFFSWLPLILGKGVPEQWMQWGWILPLWVWSRDVLPHLWQQ